MLTMPDRVKEKLVELLQHDDCPLFMVFGDKVDVLADYLIANGVTVQEWIPVSEPPEENGYYWCYVLTSCVCDKKVYEQIPLYWENDVWLYRHNSYRMCKNVTHWMPLPQPPKGE